MRRSSRPPPDHSLGEVHTAQIKNLTAGLPYDECLTGFFRRDEGERYQHVGAFHLCVVENDEGGTLVGGGLNQPLYRVRTVRPNRMAAAGAEARCRLQGAATGKTAEGGIVPITVGLSRTRISGRTPRDA